MPNAGIALITVGFEVVTSLVLPSGVSTDKLSEGGETDLSRWFLLAATWAVLLPFAMNTAGWLLTESGRQPWIVQGLKLTRNGVSPSVSFTDLVISLVAFGLLYTALGVIDVALMVRYSRKEIAPAPAPVDEQARVPSMLY